MPGYHVRIIGPSSSKTQSDKSCLGSPTAQQWIVLHPSYVRACYAYIQVFIRKNTEVFLYGAKLHHKTPFENHRPDQEKVSGVQRLVKAYQEEIDALAKRSRASDSAFFSLYKALYEAPDPAQALERMASDRPRAAASEVGLRARSAGGGGGGQIHRECCRWSGALD